MFNIGTPELIMIFVVALIVFGPRRLPEIGRSLAKAVYELKKSLQDFRQVIEQEPPEEIRKEVEEKLKENKDKPISG